MIWTCLWGSLTELNSFAMNGLVKHKLWVKWFVDKRHACWISDFLRSELISRFEQDLLQLASFRTNTFNFARFDFIRCHCMAKWASGRRALSTSVQQVALSITTRCVSISIYLPLAHVNWTTATTRPSARIPPPYSTQWIRYLCA